MSYCENCGGDGGTWRVSPTGRFVFVCDACQRRAEKEYAEEVTK